MRNPLKPLAFAALAGLSPSTWAASNIVIDNDRVTVWDVQLNANDTSPDLPSNLDAFAMFIEGGKLELQMNQGAAKKLTQHYGDAIFFPKGSNAKQTALTSNVHEVIVALKDSPSVTYPDTSGLPPAFPRPGSVKVLENPRVVVWHYSWVRGKATPMHFHDKDVVVAYRYDGALKSVTPDGTATVNAYKTGDIRFNKGNRAHYELLTDPRQSAVMAELK